MKRLIDLSADDALTARAHVLIRTLGPTVESEARFLRVRRSLDAPRPAAAPRWVWRTGVVAAVLGVSAAAVAGGRLFIPSVEPTPVVTTPTDDAHQPPVSKKRAPARPVPPSVAIAEPNESAEVAAPLPSLKAPRVHSPGVSEMSDIARVHEAAKALRRDGDAARSLQLLEGSGRPIAGPLAEEALALRIEASMSRGDGRQGRLASAYLARFPHGRYRDLAKRALAGQSP